MREEISAVCTRTMLRKLFLCCWCNKLWVTHKNNRSSKDILDSSHEWEKQIDDNKVTEMMFSFWIDNRETILILRRIEASNWQLNSVSVVCQISAATCDVSASRFRATLSSGLNADNNVQTFEWNSIFTCLAFSHVDCNQNESEWDKKWTRCVYGLFIWEENENNFTMCLFLFRSHDLFFVLLT